MKHLTPQQVKGDHFALKMREPRHMAGKRPARETDIPESFGATLAKALGKINDKQLQSDELVQRFLKGDPSVESHDVMISVRKAEQSLAFTKAVRDRLLRAWSELQSIR